MNNIKEKLKDWFLPSEDDKAIVDFPGFKRSIDKKSDDSISPPKFLSGKNPNLIISKQPQIFTLNHYLEVQEVAKSLIFNKDVIVDISNLDNKQKYRAIDFLSGVIFVIDGYRKKLDTNIYLFSKEKQ